jgi:uncharacterized SAM-binding protein YcdF (DUF218 family)
MSPYEVSLILLGIGLLMLWFTSKIRWAKAIITVSAFGFILLSYPGWWNFLVERLEYQYPVFDADRNDLDGIHWIVVFGGGSVKSDVLPTTSQLGPAALARLSEGMRIARILTAAKFMISGDTDAAVLKSAALDLGIDPNRIVIEDKAKDTAQQAVEIKRIVKNDRIILVTSAIHMPRSMALFNKQGIETVPAPADFYIRHTNLESAPSWGGFRFYPSSGGRPESRFHGSRIRGVAVG